MAEILDSPVCSVFRSFWYLFSLSLASHLVNRCRKLCYFFHTVCVKGPTPLRHGRTCEILLALENGNFHGCLPATSVKILSIQYFNVPHHLATDSRRICTRCILFPANDLSTDDEPVGPSLIRVRLFSISYHLTPLHALRLYAPYVTHLFVYIRRSTLLPF